MVPPKTAILTDSTCDIPPSLLAKYHIEVIPQIIIWGDQTYRDRIDLSPTEFYQRLSADPVHPSTTQPSPVDFQDSYQKLFAAGAEQILVITVSGEMSGTYQLACQVARDFPKPIRVIDSKGPTMSLGWQVLAAAQSRDRGEDLNQMIQKAKQVRENLQQYVYLDTLEYLHKGGRIGTASMWIGSVLQFKPLVRINHQTGIVEAAGRARTRKNGIALLWEEFFQSFPAQKPTHIAVLHGNQPDQAQALGKRIQEEYSPQELIINITGPVLGVNTGPGALALCGY
ncbi:MAG: DegV family protein [Anaerolineales bacterium]|nr:DegV family protein [Anaerolineales bacterium]